MSDRFVITFTGSGGNDAIHGIMTELGDTLRSEGLNVVQFSANEAELQHAADLLASGKVDFALTWLGFAADFSVYLEGRPAPVNAFEAFRVPLLKFQADSPAYFSARHGDLPANSVNVYPAAEFAKFRQRWLPDVRALTAIVPPFPLAPIPRENVAPQRRRNGKLVFLKNGNSPQALRQLWNEKLAAPVATRLGQMAEAIAPPGLACRPLDIGEWVAERLREDGIDPDRARTFVILLTAQLDDYLRRLKSTMIAEALLDFPVVIQGDAWEHLDARGRRAQLVPGQDFASSARIFAEELGIIDMAPNIESAPHDRIARAAGSYSAFLTNRQAWLNEGIPGFDALTFEFTADSIRERVEAALSDPGRFVEFGIAFGERFREHHTEPEFARRLIEIAEIARLQYGAAAPQLQPYFIWPAA